MRQVVEADLEDLAIGAAVLGTGGGGNPYIGKLLAQQAIRQHGPVELVSVDEVPDDAVVVPSAMMGAPTVMVEKLPRGDEIIRAFKALQDFIGKPITHTVSIEAGGLNSTTPFSVPATIGIALVDADAMGRAFPEIQMVTPTMYGVSATPMALADEKGNAAIIETIDNRWTERLARSLTIDMGCTAMIALYGMDGKMLKEAMVPGTIGLAEERGRLIRETRAAHGDPIGAVLGRLNGFRVFTGKIADVARRTETGFARGEAKIEGTGDETGSTLELRFQNEHLVALRDGEIVVSVPDLIIVLDAETGEPITTEELRYGFRVTVIATAMMGAPTVMIEKIPRGDEAVASLRALEAHLGRTADATMPIECGGINSTMPLVVGARTGLPVIDADGMGRAFPELQMETFHVYGVPGTPMAITNEHGDTTLVTSHDNEMMEWLARGITIRMGGSSLIAEYSMDGATAKRTSVPGTISLGIAVGRCLRDARARHEDPFESLIAMLRGTLYGLARVVFEGKVVDVFRRTTEGFAKGNARIESTNGEGPLELR